MYCLIFIRISIHFVVVKRPTSSSRKVNYETNRITIPESKLEDSELESGEWAEVRLVTTGRNAGKLILERPNRK